jgi:hypothetical protein
LAVFSESFDRQPAAHVDISPVMAQSHDLRSLQELRFPRSYPGSPVLARCETHPLVRPESAATETK